MDQQPDTQPVEATEIADDDVAPGAEQEQPVGFWRRVFGSKKPVEAPEPEAAAEPEPDEAAAEPELEADGPQQPLVANAPRKRTRTIFDRVEEEQKKRYTRAARLRRERLANAIGERVEEVLSGHMIDGESRLAASASGKRKSSTPGRLSSPRSVSTLMAKPGRGAS